ncbi:MAG: arylamine N-acetyltransferase [Opitutaceae bacterium]|nr:arylamine N-acetyltransferase [Opitutaceae bacterium]MBP9913535.1 arylamine N-acetyltransferase [Opitutaceae bacterium]
MSAVPDLDAYFARIGYTGPREPTAAVLTAIQRRHVYTLPFENLDILLGRPIRIDLPSVEQKLVREKRGGYCFEQNLLLQAMLTALGFKVTPLIARVRWQAPAEVITALTHMALMVEAGGERYLIDGGFGSASLTAALRLDTAEPQPTTHEPRRILPRDGGHVQQTQLSDGEWADLYQFTLDSVPVVDFEVGNWWTSTHPASRFTQNLAAAIAGDGLRHTIFNREFTTRWTDGRVEQRTLASPDELLDVLATHFNLHFPSGTHFNAPALQWPE